MRIIGGKHKGRKLRSFDGTDVRPTSDRAREALFNIFQTKIFGCDFYDGFCGSGAVGIEALSRGANVVMTDISPLSVKLTNENLAMIAEKAEVVESDCLKYLSTTKKRFDIIFLDPPYATDLGKKALAVVSCRGLLKEGGFAIFESDKEYVEAFDEIAFIRSRKYGKAIFNIYGKK